MATYDMQSAAGLIARPETSDQALADIAAQHPCLRAAVRQHPNASPGLIAWIDQTDAAVRASDPPRQRRTGLAIGAIAAAAVLIATAAIATPWLTRGSGGVGDSPLQQSLAFLAAPDGDFTLELIDTERLEEALGDPLPIGGTEQEMLDWVSDAVSGEPRAAATALIWQSPHTYASSPELLSLTFTAGGQVRVYDFEERTWTRSFARPVSTEQLDEAFGPSHRGVWEDEAFSLSHDDGAGYYAWTESELPRERPEAAESLGSEESVQRLLALLERSGAYYYVIERGPLVEMGIEQATGERSGPIETWGSALAVRDGQSVVTAAYDLGSPQAAESNRELIAEASARAAAEADQSEPRRVYVDDSFVVAEYEIDSAHLEATTWLLGRIAAG